MSNLLNFKHIINVFSFSKSLPETINFIIFFVITQFCSLCLVIVKILKLKIITIANNRDEIQLTSKHTSQLSDIEIQNYTIFLLQKVRKVDYLLLFLRLTPNLHKNFKQKFPNSELNIFTTEIQNKLIYNKHTFLWQSKIIGHLSGPATTMSKNMKYNIKINKIQTYYISYFCGYDNYKLCNFISL